MTTRWLLLLPAALALAAAQPKELRYEAEDWSEPKSAWLVDKESPDHWNLWSKDKDADKKWSGGVVFRSPAVTADRAKTEDGAPALHTRITGIPAGTYDVVLPNVGRGVGVSLDNKTWIPYRGGILARAVEIKDGVFELWVDDRFVRKENPGPCYYDCVVFRPTVARSMGLVNPGFESGEGTQITGWNFWSRQNKGRAVPVGDVKHGGQRSVLLTHDGDQDWAFTCSEQLPVKPGDRLTVRAWVRSQGTNSIAITVVALAGGKTVRWDIGSESTDGTHDWKELVGDVRVPDGVDAVQVRFVGSGACQAWVDDVSLLPGARPVVTKPKLEGHAKTRVTEQLDRGLVATRTDRGVYLSWRLLKGDPADTAFNVYRVATGGAAQRLNAQPLRWTTDYLDAQPGDGKATYQVRAVLGGQEQAVGATAVPNDGYTAIKLQGNYQAQKVGLGDLDGDGKLDYVIKQPHENIDPWDKYWYKSPDTYKLEAYHNDGRFMWRVDLGWGIERGIWYSPYLVYDFDGDGRAEVAAKMGEGDPRDPDGRVQTGREWVVVFDGLTGKERARAPWPNREGLGTGLSGYNLASRNLLAVAYLDGRTPYLIVQKGTYTLMKVDAYELTGTELKPAWKYTSKEGGAEFRGQGAHFTHAADVDGDGRDEVVLGSAVLDDNGTALWSTGLGHPDHCYVGDLDPSHPGLEIYYGIETRQSKGNGMCLVDAKTGRILWGWDKPTIHIHATGMCGDFDATQPGCEAYSADCIDHKPNGDRWFWNLPAGKVFSRDLDLGFGTRYAYWDADLQHELVRGSRVIDFDGGPQPGTIDGSQVLVADVLGDWREEVITSRPGELRIYSTTIPAFDRRVCLLQDPIYRLDTAMNAMGYTQNATTSYCLEATAPNLNLTAVPAKGEDGPKVRVVVSAPLDRAVRGQVSLASSAGELSPARFAVDLAPGARSVQMVALPAGARAGSSQVTAHLQAGDVDLRNAVPITVPSRPLAGVPLAQAEDFAGQGGGSVQIRTDKVGMVGKATSHWDKAGHWLEWSLVVPRAGRYQLTVRYCTNEAASRAVTVDGQALGTMTFSGTSGMGSSADDWAHATWPKPLELAAGKHVIRLQNTDDKPVNLDYLALVPVP